MSVAARKFRPQPQSKIFHAAILVTRTEEWWMEAETIDQAQALLAAGEGHHAALGERVDVELEAMLEEHGG